MVNPGFMGFMTPKMGQHLSPISGKRKRKLLFELEEKEDKQLNFFEKLLEEMNQAEPDQCK